jgi:hypothetical protein
MSEHDAQASAALPDPRREVRDPSEAESRIRDIIHHHLGTMSTSRYEFRARLKRHPDIEDF